MSTGEQIAIIIAAGLAAFFGYRMVKNKPELFAKENLIQSLGTVGWLTILILGVITLCVLMLRH